ncbi:MAG: hypothetical protein R2851_01545 [Caldilineaceae bacterium]
MVEQLVPFNEVNFPRTYDDARWPSAATSAHDAGTVGADGAASHGESTGVPLSSGRRKRPGSVQPHGLLYDHGLAIPSVVSCCFGLFDDHCLCSILALLIYRERDVLLAYD